jgi:7,8-dihydropterin-6-yl-methyl-4-(beta-D-ribofuranosyl)aminobenzene 5'-phosphate synthase
MQRRALLTALGALAASPGLALAAGEKVAVGKLRVTILDTMVSGNSGLDGEWGFAALVEADGRRILYDTGSSPGMVLHNVRSLKLDLSGVEDVILSHSHDDHTEGLLTLRTELRKHNPKALSRCHVGAGIFAARETGDGAAFPHMQKLKTDYEALGGFFVIHDAPAEIAPGVWFSGPVPRRHNERNWNPGLFIRSAEGRAEDTLPEDSALVINTGDGTVIVTGCGHAGVMNICERARDILGPQPIAGVIGGLHLFLNNEASIAATGATLKALGVRKILAAHCTGFEATYILRRALDASPADVAVATVGAQWISGIGIQTGMLAQLGRWP